jgi:3,4-dihydroxy 2-butanone 4-phosphate synthase/GTP cyclohydrolase II
MRTIPGRVVEVAQVLLPTPFGEFELRAFETPPGHVYLALILGDVSGPEPVLTRVHSECLTGDSLRSLRCDCGPQLTASMRAVALQERGVIVYCTGHEGRGAGLIGKLRAYMEQENGADTVEANELLGYPVDSRDYGDAAEVLKALGVERVRLLTNDPGKAMALRNNGVEVEDIIPIATSAHLRNARYLNTKRLRLGHVQPTGPRLDGNPGPVVDVLALLGEVADRSDSPYVILKFAQTLDGRIATSTGDSRWISGEDERRVSHALRAACDAVLVGIGTVVADDPQLTVRMVEGVSPARVVLDPSLRVPMTSKVLDGGARTFIVGGPQAPPSRRRELEGAGCVVIESPVDDSGIDLAATLSALRRRGIRSLLVEGGATVLTSFLHAGLVDRLIVSLSPKVMGRGLDAIGGLGVSTVDQSIRLASPKVNVVGEDVIVSGYVRRPNDA